MKLLKVLLTFSIILAGFLGDYIVFRSKYSESFAFRAVADSTVHATIGFLSALIFFSHRLNVPTNACFYYIVICTVISSLIDIDHVFVARSINLKDYTNLKQRGIFHSTSFWLLITIILISYSYITKDHNILILTFMFILAFSSHHIRDANRRGLWLYPFGHTEPLHKYVYITFSAVLPHIFSITFVYLRNNIATKDYNIIETV